MARYYYKKKKKKFVPKDLASLKELKIKTALMESIPEDITQLYPEARNIKRHFILHIGETNTGKTHDALEDFYNAGSGMYLAPLRLLALEIQEMSLARGINCSLTTGEEKDIRDGAKHLSCTVEKMDMSRHFDVCVIDEAQMVADSDRGWAWTEAILGVNADVVHVCMSPNAIHIVKMLIKMCGDTYTDIRHKRNSRLIVEDHDFIFPDDIRDGDALVAFSRRKVLMLATLLKKEGYKVSVIYGSLPYSVRKAESEFAKVVDLIFETYKDFNITDYRCVLSLRDPEDKVKYHDDDEMWNNAENALRKVLNDIGIEYTEEIGEAAFYGPKLDVNVKPAIGNEYTLSTCQLDFCLPSKFNLTYIDKDGQRKTPVVLHRAILGSLDRFMAYILEETKGNLPLWLAPVQATILPVKNEDEELNAYAHGLYDYLADNGIRVEIDERAEKLGYRVREAQVKKIPYLIVLGKNEAAEGTVSYRLHGEQKSTTVSKDEFVAMLKDEIATKKNNPAAAK